MCIPDEAWTAKQVADRAGQRQSAVCEEWQLLGPRVDELLSLRGGRLFALVADVWSHEQDIRNAIGRPDRRDGPGLMLALSVAKAMRPKLSSAGIAPLHLTTPDVDWTIGEGEPGASVAAPSYEVARAALGRRSADQIRNWRWEGDPSPYLHVFSVFPSRATDLVE